MAFFIPMMMLFIAPLVQAVYSSKKVNDPSILPLALIGWLTFLLGMIISVAAVVVSMVLLPAEVKCAQGCLGLCPLGIIFSLLCTPVIYGVYKAKLNSKNRNLTL
jgi:hypothetical protein